MEGIGNENNTENIRPYDAEDLKSNKTASDDKVSRQHDRFIRYALQHRKVFIPFLAKHLPPHVLQLIDLAAAQPCKPSTIDHSLRERIADATYLAPLNSGNGDALICAEHVSNPKPDMPVHLGVHLLRLSAAYRKSYKGKKSLMVFGLLYHNGKKPYSQPTDLFASLNEAEREVSHQTLGSLHLVDTHTMHLENSPDHTMLQVFELATKHIFDQHVEATLAKLWPHLTVLEADEPDGEEFSQATCRYVLYMAPQEDFDDIIKSVRETLGLEAAERIMTLGQKLEYKGRQQGRQEGWQQGRQEGLQEGREEVALSMLKKGMATEVVAQIAQLSKERIAELLTKLGHGVKGR